MFNVSAVIAAYLIGSLSFAVIVSKYYGMDDPRTYGSGNPGATNVLRSGKKKAAALTLLGDALKGLVAVVLARCLQDALNLSDITIAAVAVAALVGHMWPLFFGFKGGKGVATALGVLLALSPATALVCATIWLVMAFGFNRRQGGQALNLILFFRRPVRLRNEPRSSENLSIYAAVCP